MQQSIENIVEVYKELGEKIGHLLYDQIKVLVREHFKKDRNAVEFKMAMGTYFFSDNNGINYDIKCVKLDSLIAEHDKEFGVTGMPMRIVRGGIVETDF